MVVQLAPIAKNEPDVIHVFRYGNRHVVEVELITQVDYKTIMNSSLKL